MMFIPGLIAVARFQEERSREALHKREEICLGGTCRRSGGGVRGEARVCTDEPLMCRPWVCSVCSEWGSLAFYYQSLYNCLAGREEGDWG